MIKVEAYGRLLDFLEKAGFSENERKVIITKQITSKGEQGSMLENLQVIDDLVSLHRIDFQITGRVDEPADEEDS